MQVVGGRVRVARRIGLFVGGVLTVLTAPGPSVASTGSSGGCRPVTVTATDLGTLGGATYPTDIDDRGRVVGGSQTANGFHAFRWDRGVMTDLTPTASDGTAVATNNRGEVLLSWVDVATGASEYGVGVWHRGTTTVVRSGPNPTVAVDINERGQVLLSWIDGTSEDGLWDGGQVEPVEAPAGSGLLPIPTNLGEGGHVAGILSSGGRQGPIGGFVWRDGVFTVMDTAPYLIREVADIDRAGRVLVNTWADQTGSARALRWDGGGYIDLGHLAPGPGAITAGSDMNERGQIVGSSTTPSGTHAFLWENGEMVDLHTFGEMDSHATLISDRGHVAGFTSLFGGFFSGFLWWCGEAVDLGTLPGDSRPRAPIAINARGQVVSGVSTLAGDRVMLSTPTRSSR
jgi:probable HAF family extracellular repeat protein